VSGWGWGAVCPGGVFVVAGAVAQAAVQEAARGAAAFPNSVHRLAADLDARSDATQRNILCESETATDTEVRVMEMKLIRENGANDPAVGYNVLPQWRLS
jgi:hypothetical protein